MKRRRHPIIPVLAGFFGLALSSHGTLLVDDSWADGSRNEQNLPAESAWYSSDSSGTSLTAAIGSITGTVPASSVQWLTYYTAAGTPATLNVGDTLKATAMFTPAGVTAQNANRGLRIGLYNFASGGTRVSANGYSTGAGTGAPGANVLGYMLNLNFGSSFGVDTPLQIMERTVVGSINLMGASGDYTTLSSGPAGSLSGSAFSSGTEYTFEFSVTRTAADSVNITTRFVGGALDISHTATDASGTTFAFDTFAIRPAASAQTASSFNFARLKVEVLPAGAVAPSITTQPQSQTVTTGQDATFTVVAEGSVPLCYQWYYNTNSPLANATNATLTLTNVQAANAGVYSVVVTNSSGSVTSSLATLTVINLVGPALTIGVPGGTVTVTFAGDPAYEYEVQRSTNLASWMVLMTTNPPQSGLIQIVDNFSGLGGAPAEAFYRLRVITLVPVAPTISTQPQSQTVMENQNATFTVAATGTAPLRYQWYFNTNTALANATNASLTINNAQTNDAGGYFLVVTNAAGSVTSVVATLAINSSVLIGFATVNGNTTGGQGGPTVTVTDRSSFISAVTANGARIVRIVGAITLGGNVRPASDKTIVGVGTDATLIGNLNVYQATNIIVQNLHLTNPGGVGDGDGITIEESSHVWIDHCTFFDCSDGELDITHGSDLVTVSWCKFYYTADTGHNFVTLVGHSDNNGGEDAGKLHVTFHHNWWSTLCHERMPRVRFGRVHLFNNYANCSGNNYCVRASIESEVLVENNFYDGIDTPYEKFDPPGLIRAVGNSTPNCTGVQSFSDTVFTPPYAYTLDPAGSVPGAVTNFAGAGIISF